MSILETIGADLAKIPALFETALVSVGNEAKTVVSGLITSLPTQALALAKQTPVGTAIVNSVSAVQAGGGNLVTATPTIVANAKTAILALDKSGSVLAGLESEVEAFAVALVDAIIADFTASPAISPLVTLFSAIL